MIKYLNKTIIFPAYLKYKGWGYKLEYLEFLKSKEFDMYESNTIEQAKRLSNILNYCISNIPFYNKSTKIENINEQNVFEKIKEFPIMTKDHIRENFDEMAHLDDKYFYKNTSGGSTGEPIVFYQDLSYILHGGALYSDSLAGYEIGDKVLYLWGSEEEIFKGSIGIKAKLVNRIVHRKKILNTFMMTDSIMSKYIREINNYRPKVIIAYVQSVYEIARYIKENNLKVYTPKSIIVSAGTLFSEHRQIIEEAFQTKVFNRYGSREVGNMAMECDSHDAMHLNPFNHFIEIVDKDGKEVGEGETGEVLVTSLTNYVMPLIRYKIGDTAIKRNEPCLCGMGVPVIQNITGRTVNIFKTREGKKIDGEYFTHLFYFQSNVKQFQVIQEDFDNLIVNIVVKGKVGELSESVENDITSKIQLVMGSNCMVSYNYLREINPSPSGKYIYTISRI